jgi:hypothetical protein
VARRGTAETQPTERTRRATAGQIANRRGLVETERFTRSLINLAAAGLRTHCSDVGTSELWLSESEAERAQAAKLCGGCPVFDQCGEAASARREKFGTWAGVDRTPIPGQIGRPPIVRRTHDDGAVEDDEAA